MPVHEVEINGYKVKISVGDHIPGVGKPATAICPFGECGKSSTHHDQRPNDAIRSVKRVMKEHMDKCDRRPK